MNLNETRALVTGGSLGIGKAIAQKLTAAGARVMITGRDANRVEQAAAEVGALPVTADVTNPEDRDRTFAEIKKKLGGLDVLVNNAGIGEFAPLSGISEAQFQSVFATNVFAVALMTQQAVELFRKQNRGNIVTVASTAALKGFESGTVYAASKFALRGMTQCWQAELRKHNIRVMEINPSEVTTAFNNPGREERSEQANKLRGDEIAHAVKAMLEMDDRGMIPELTVWATNPWS